MLSPLMEAISDDEIKMETFLPTHVNRNKALLQNALEWIKIGWFVGLTAENTQKHPSVFWNPSIIFYQMTLI